jgi:hypothetical protein
MMERAVCRNPVEEYDARRANGSQIEEAHDAIREWR